MEYEQETLTKVIEARAAAINAAPQGPQAQAQAENMLTGALRRSSPSSRTTPTSRPTRT